MEHFLDKKYPDLAGSKPVIRATRKAREQGEKPYTRDELIDSYISRLGKLAHDPRGFSLLKQYILSEYVTKEEEIPKNWKEKMTQMNPESVLSDQKASLEQWINHLTSQNLKSVPDKLKYWVFRSVVKLQEFDKEKKEYPKHSKGTVKRFPDLNEEALAYVLDSMQKKYRDEKLEFEYDIDGVEQEEFENFLEKEDFAKLYAWANTVMNPIPEKLLKITDGEWKKFEKGSSALDLVNALKNKGTGWCTVGLRTAHEQLKGGDFYIYFSKDDEGNATIPRIAILKEANTIAEVRGISYKQNIDPYISKILKAKLDEFPDKEKYLKKEHDTKEVSHLVEKNKQNEEFSREELEFLHERNEKIEYFGEYADPKIKELQNGRDKIADYCIIYECTPEQIATETKDITENTAVYIGNLTSNDANMLNDRKNPLVVDGDANFDNNTTLVSIPKNITFRGSAGFNGCTSLVTISQGAEFCGNTYFTECSGLVELPKGVIFKEQVYFSQDVSLIKIPGGAIFRGMAYFNGCTSLSEISKNVKFEDDVSFFRCLSLVEIPDGLTFNGTVYFNNCTSLIKIPDNTVFNGFADFSNCTSLMEIPESVIKTAGGTITLPEHLREKYEKYPNVIFE
jgi:hypothetical protein